MAGNFNDQSEDKRTIAASDEAARHWIASRFTITSTDADDTLLLYNSYMGAFARIPTQDRGVVADALQRGIKAFPRGILAELSLNGFFVPDGTDEEAMANRMYRNQASETNVLELILMPNENCNFRCKYCSQSFARNRMSKDLVAGLERYVQSQAPKLSVLTVGWFGGEPLTAHDIIKDISTRFQAICHEHNIEYSSSMTTNGYLLSPAVLRMLFAANVRRFQITLDGLPEDHDRLRVLTDGHTGTFQRILNNLRFMRDQPELFSVVIRVNFDRGSSNKLDTFLSLLESEFSGDHRFFLDFHPVGKWGGPNDRALRVCGADEGRYLSLEFARKAGQRGFDLFAMRERLKPLGSRCYAADPHSFVIGSDGTVYKCTVAFEDPRNHVGRLTESGELIIDEDRHRLWISGPESGSSCEQCSFQPSCHGGACPLERMNTGEPACPTIKKNMDQALRVLSTDFVRTIQITRLSAASPSQAGPA